MILPSGPRPTHRTSPPPRRALPILTATHLAPPPTTSRKLRPPVRQNVGPNATTTSNRCAPRAPDTSDRNGGRPASRVEPRIAVALQSAWCFPPRTWPSRPTGVLVIGCFSRALSTGCAGWVRPGSWTTLARSRCGRRSRTSATTVTPTPLQRHSLQQLAIGCNSTRERLRSAIGMLPTIDYEQTPMVTSHFPADTCCPSQRSAQRPAEAALGRCREPARSTGTSSVHSSAAVAVATLTDS